MYLKKQEEFKQIFEKLISDKKEIYVNGPIGSIIANLPKTIHSKVNVLSLKETEKIYILGKYEHCEIFVNPYKRWTDLIIEDKDGNQIFDFQGKIDIMDLI